MSWYSLVPATYAADNCVDFSAAEICLDLEKSSSTRYSVNRTIQDSAWSVTLRCQVTTPDGFVYGLQNCQDVFYYNGTSNASFRFDVYVNGLRKSTYYDIDARERDDQNSSNNSSNNDDREFDIRVDDSTPEEDQYVDVTIEVLEDGDTDRWYDGTIEFEIDEKRNGSRFNASSSDYTLDEDEYEFRSSDDGEVTFNNLIRFEQEGDFRLVVEDNDENIVETQEFEVGWWSNSNSDDADEIEIDADTDVPEDDEIDITIEILDDDGDRVESYTDRVEFEVEYREDDDDDWEDVTRDTAYVRFDDDERFYDFRSSDDGSKKLTNFIEFRREGEFRLIAEQDNDSSIRWIKIFEVDDNNSNTSGGDGDPDDIEITADFTPEEDTDVDILLEIFDRDGDLVEDYTERVDFEIEYREDSGDSRRDVTNNGNYVDFNDNTYYFFRDSDDGKVVLNDFLEFKRSGEFRVTIEDRSDSSVKWVEDFDVDDDHSTNNNIDDDEDNDPDEIKIFADTSVEEDSLVSVILRIVDEDNDRVDNYSERVNFTVEQRDSSSDNRDDVTDDESYVEFDDEEDYYKFRTNDDGQVELDEYFEFKREGDFRLTAREDGNSSIRGSFTFDVDSSNSTDNDIDINDDDEDADEIKIEADTSPETDTQVDIELTIVDDRNNRVENYTQEVEFEVEYREDSGDSRDEITNQSSYVEFDDDDTYEFRSSDDGKVLLEEFIEFKREGDYRITIEEEGNDDVQGTETFDVDDNNSTNNNGWSSSNGDAEDIEIDADTSPETDTEVDLIITIVDDDDDTVEDYDETIEFEVEYRRDSGDSRDDVTDNSSYVRLEDNEYTFRSSDDGEAELEDFIEFTREGEFRVTIQEEGDSSIEWQETFDVDDNNSTNNNNSSNNNGDADEIKIIADSTPKEDDKVDITLEVIDDDEDTVEDYRERVEFTVEYREDDDESYDDITNDESYVRFDNDDDFYDFSSSDDGRVTLRDFIEFRKEGEYKLEVEQDDDSSINGEKEFTVDRDNTTSSSSNSDADDIEITADTTPKEDDEIDITIEIFDSRNNRVESYSERIDFEVEYRSSAWSSREDVTDDSSIVRFDGGRDYYNMRSSDDGKVTLKDFIEFRKEWTYRLYAEENGNDDVKGDKLFDVDDANVTNNSGGDPDEIEVSADRTPPEEEYIDVTIEIIDEDEETVEDYDGTIRFEIEYRDNGRRIDVTNSSSYVRFKNSSSRTYDFRSSDDGRVTLRDIIRFEREGDFRISVEDEDESSVDGSIEVDVDEDHDEDSSDADEIDITADSIIDVDDYVDLEIEIIDSSNSIVTDYANTVKVTVDYRSSSTASRRDVTFSTTYVSFAGDKDYDFRTSDRGRKNLNNFLRLRTEGQYKIEIFEEGNSDIKGTKTIEVGDGNDNSFVDNLDGFTSSQIRAIEDIYNIRPDFIERIEDQDTDFRRNNSRQLRQAQIYNDMRDVLDGSRNREYDNYREFYDELVDFIRDTRDLL